jgi:hypothetical protein
MTKRKIIITIVVVAVIIGGIFGWKKYKNYKAGKEQSMSVWEALVMPADQKASDPVEDARASLKAGDVIAIFPEGHPWSDTEKTSYLIVKIKTTQENAQKLLQPVTKEIKNNAKNPDRKDMGPEMEAVRARKYKLDVKIPPVNDIMKGQPYADKVFDEGIIREK